MGGPSEGDQRRIDGANQLEKVFDWASRNSDQILDTSWDKGARICVAGTSRTSSSRAWFALWETNGVRLSTTTGYDCASWLASMRGDALQIHDAVAKASEGARRVGVYPGTMRDLRRSTASTGMGGIGKSQIPNPKSEAPHSTISPSSSSPVKVAIDVRSCTTSASAPTFGTSCGISRGSIARTSTCCCATRPT